MNVASGKYGSRPVSFSFSFGFSVPFSRWGFIRFVFLFITAVLDGFLLASQLLWS